MRWQNELISAEEVETNGSEAQGTNDTHFNLLLTNFYKNPRRRRLWIEFNG